MCFLGTFQRAAAGVLLLCVVARWGCCQAPDTPGEKTAPPVPSLQEALGKVAGVLADAASRAGLEGTCAVFPAGSSATDGYATAVFPLHLRRTGVGLTSTTCERVVDLPPTKRLPLKLPARYSAGAGSARCTSFILLRVSSGKVHDRIEAALYAAADGKQKAATEAEFRFPEKLAFLHAEEQPEWDAKEREWLELFEKVLPNTEPALAAHRQLVAAEGDYFFRRAFWKQAYEALKRVTDQSLNSRFLRLVYAAQMAGERQEASALVEAALKKHPDSGFAYALKGWLAYRQQEFADALLLLEQARLNDVKHEGYYKYADALVAKSRGKKAEAENRLREAAGHLPNDSFVLLGIARFYWDEANLEEAVKFYRQAIGTGAGTAQIWSELGLALDAAGQVEQAIEAFEAAFRRAPARADIARHLSSLLERNGAYQKALDVLREAVAAAPDDGSLVAAYADAAISRWRLEEAQLAYEKALKRQPDFTYGKVRLAEILTMKRKYAEAEEALRQVLAASPPCPMAQIALGRLLTRMGRTDDAAAALTEAAASFQYETAARVALSLAYLSAGRHEEAIVSAQKAVPKGDAEAYAVLARAFMAARDMEKALSAATSALERDARSVGAHLAMALVLSRQNKPEEALKYCEKAIKLNPYCVETLKLAGLLHLDREQFGEAARVWRKALSLDRWDAELHWRLAELLREHLKDAIRAVRHYRAHLELGGNMAEKAREWVEKLK